MERATLPYPFGKVRRVTGLPVALLHPNSKGIQQSIVARIDGDSKRLSGQEILEQSEVLV